MARPKKENKTNEDIAKRIAYAIVRANYGNTVMVLPNWYKLQSGDDMSQVNAALERSARYFKESISKELLSLTRKK
jgi:hypothetical protein